MYKPYKHRIKTYTEQLFTTLGVSIEMIRNVSISLMMGTMHAISSLESKQRVWKWLTELIDTNI